MYTLFSCTLHFHVLCHRQKKERFQREKRKKKKERHAIYCSLARSPPKPSQEVNRMRFNNTIASR
jgi:hypothetical protein